MFGGSGRHFGIFAVADCGLEEESSGWDRSGGEWFGSEAWGYSGEGDFEHCGRRGGGSGGGSVGTFIYDVMIVAGGA